jgi:hypothetical protein
MSDSPFTKSSFKPVQETTFGMYVWELPNGEILGNTDGDILNVMSEQYDLGKMKILRDAATHYGYPEGKCKFLPGRRRVTEDELAEQVQRLAEGKTPDIYDAPALIDELKNGQQHGG